MLKTLKRIIIFNTPECLWLRSHGEYGHCGDDGSNPEHPVPVAELLPELGPCPLEVRRLAKKLPEQETNDSVEGDEGHGIAQKLVRLQPKGPGSV